MNLTTEYLGLALKNPLVASSSPLTWSLDSATRLQDAGIAALIMPSLFEEQLEIENERFERFIMQQSTGYAEAPHFHPQPAAYQDYKGRYLAQLGQLKQALDIPVIASLNGISDGGWVEHARELEHGGADALELNIYYVAANPKESASDVEMRYIDVLQAVRRELTIPVNVKLSNHFSALIPMVRQLQQAGAAGVTLFNRFYQPDIDLETLRVEPKIELSTSQEALERIRWVAILRHQVTLSLAITGGVHNAEDIIKGLLAGADACCLASVLIINGPEYAATLLKTVEAWMQAREYESLRQLKGSLSYANAINPADYERANYLEVLKI